MQQSKFSEVLLLSNVSCGHYANKVYETTRAQKIISYESRLFAYRTLHFLHFSGLMFYLVALPCCSVNGSHLVEIRQESTLCAKLELE